MAGIGSTISAANTAAEAATTGLIPAALDEVSAALASLFSAHGQAYQGYQALSAQAAHFHDQFVQALNAGANLYASAEAANASPMQAALNLLSAPGQALTASSPGSPTQQPRRHN
ncbi:hypothetical protein MGAST_12500 [Mycobacterium gastri 'Wayne']|uniref:PE domain-containing protein n=1 Tax=Mycobacterium gastri TaxID=1777 RepID=A0A1X1UQ58_MYCGS|nr:hypothetical protein MGAST_12500 [Mycobacterium gastri 'Wayne']ORV58809.1 hypothetical protein AWC07_19980 [Mycobacterium gastri]